MNRVSPVILVFFHKVRGINIRVTVLKVYRYYNRQIFKFEKTKNISLN